MALVLKDRVKETTTTVSTGTYTLAGAVVGYQAFSVIGNGNTTYYAVTNGTDWEVGIGTYTLSGTTLSRDTILESSNSGNAVNWSAGVKEIFCTYPAERSMYVDGTTITPAISARLGFTNLAQGSALSVLGVTGNATADNASIAAGTDNQVLRRSGTALAFGAVNLASADAVTGTLAVTNGGTGITSFGAGVATWLGTPSSANLASAMTDETGSGLLVFGTTPVITGLREKSAAVAASDIDLSLGNYFTKTISGTTTFTVSNVATSGDVAAFILILTNGGSATVNWFSGVTWNNATPPTLTTSGIDILGFFTINGGTTWRGLVLAQAVA